MTSPSLKPPKVPVVKLGISSILAQSSNVAKAFGRDRGFKIMVLALSVAVSASLSTAVIAYLVLRRAF